EHLLGGMLIRIFFRMNAVDRTGVHTGAVFGTDTGLGDYVCHRVSGSYRIRTLKLTEYSSRNCRDAKLQATNRACLHWTVSFRYRTTHACVSDGVSLGSYSTIYPATALAATVSGEARYIWPGPLRPGKFLFWALMTIWSGRVETPGPALMQAPQLGSITIAPALLKISRYPWRTQYSRVSCEPNWI